MWKVENGSFMLAPVLSWSDVGGDHLVHWRMDIEVYDPFKLPGFMAEIFRNG